MKKEDIQKIIDLEINPFLNSHDGGVEILKLDEEHKKLTLRLLGKCCTCLNSLDTIENLINLKIKNHFSNINISVETGISDELLEIAKKYLRGGK